MRLLHLALAVVIALVAVSNGMTVFANEISATEEEERRGGGGGGGGHGGGGGGGHGGGGGGGGHVSGGGGGGHVSGGGVGHVSGGGGGTVYGTHTSTGLMYPNGHSDSKTKKKKCNRFTNWFKRLFDKSVKKCPKKGEEETTRRLRA